MITVIRMVRLLMMIVLLIGRWEACSSDGGDSEAANGDCVADSAGGECYVSDKDDCGTANDDNVSDNAMVKVLVVMVMIDC